VEGYARVRGYAQGEAGATFDPCNRPWTPAR